MHGYGVRNKEQRKILDFCPAMDMAVAKTVLKRRASHLVTYDSGLSKTQVDYCLIRRGQSNFLKDTEVLQHVPLVCNFKTKVKDTRTKSLPWREIWKLP